ncbi:MAG: glycosyltransferase family 4 protein [Chlorobi bacterium]|nr:glycosyltransferase family 4 protein [Chlorobiota bacterium]MCI0716075.1 glycosyltransferase family 4 protein [Chlorobiota bacterium]
MKVIYVSSNGGIHDFRFLNKLEKDYEVLFLHYAANEIIDEIDKLENLEIISKKPAFKSFPLISETGHFKRVLNEFKPDIVHTGYVWQVGVLASLAGIHPHLSMPWGSDILIEPDNSIIKKKLVKKVVNQCDHIQCDAEFVKQKIINDYGLDEDKITVFPWGIDLSLFKKFDRDAARAKLHIDNDKFVVVFNRYLEQVYGINYLLEAFKIFAKDKEDVLLVMLSEGDLKNSVLKFITENKMEVKINLIGKVSNFELPEFLNAADIYVSSSLSDGTSLSLLEAMACGMGLVVTDVPAIREWVNEENGLIVERKNSPRFAKAMQTYYENRDLIKKHGERSSEIASSRADWDKNYLKLKEIYTKLLS